MHVANVDSCQHFHSNWKTWLQDESSTERDHEGPKGFLRLWVKTGTTKDKVTKEGIRKESSGIKISKKATQDVMDKALKNLSVGHDRTAVGGFYFHKDRLAGLPVNARDHELAPHLIASDGRGKHFDFQARSVLGRGVGQSR